MALPTAFGRRVQVYFFEEGTWTAKTQRFNPLAET